MSSISKWWQTIIISISNTLTYRLSFILQVLGPTVVFFFIKYNLWSSIYRGDPEKEIVGFTFKAMIIYHLWSLIVSLLAKGHTAMKLSEEIRLGRISSYLIYPFNFWEFHTASFIGFQIVQSFVCLITIFIVNNVSFIPFELSLHHLFIGYIYCLFASFFWFSIQYLTGLIAFWLDETWMLRVIFQIATSFLSGAIIPLEFFPETFYKILYYTPFPYLGHFPIKLFMGEIANPLSGFIIVAIWTAIFVVLNKIVWNKGLRLYTAAGM